MTTIQFFCRGEDIITGFSISGHVDFSLIGNDILCAAVSTLVSHTIGSIQEFTSDACENIVDEDTPKVVFRLPDEISDTSKVLLNAFASSIDDLAFAHPSNITVEYIR